MEVVDPYRNLQRARELSEKYKFGNNDNIVILDVEGRTKFINAADMAELDTSSSMFAQNPAVRAFKGEEALTSALLELLEDKQKKVYFLSGHGEPLPNAEELSSLKAYLERQNLLLQALNLNNSEAVPTDASALVVLSPKTDLSERDLKLLDDYWNERNGRILLLLGGNLKTPRLAQWLASFGVTLNQDVVVKAGTMLTLQDGKPVLREGIATTAVGFTPPQSKPILKDIAELDMELAGMSQSMDVDPAKTAPAKIRAIQLIATTADFWGETEYVAAANPPAVKDAQKDHLGPLTLGVALEHGALQDARMKVDTGRMILIGNSAFVSNDGLRRSDLGGDFAVYSLNWLLNREELAGIPPKPKQALTLSLSDRQMNSIALAVLGIIPCTVALLGALVWWRRQN